MGFVKYCIIIRSGTCGVLTTVICWKTARRLPESAHGDKNVRSTEMKQRDFAGAVGSWQAQHSPVEVLCLKTTWVSTFIAQWGGLLWDTTVSCTEEPDAFSHHLLFLQRWGLTACQRCPLHPKHIQTFIGWERRRIRGARELRQELWQVLTWEGETRRNTSGPRIISASGQGLEGLQWRQESFYWHQVFVISFCLSYTCPRLPTLNLRPSFAVPNLEGVGWARGGCTESGAPCCIRNFWGSMMEMKNSYHPQKPCGRCCGVTAQAHLWGWWVWDAPGPWNCSLSMRGRMWIEWQWTGCW